MISRVLIATALGLGMVAAQPAVASTFDNVVTSTPGLLGYYPFTPASQANSTVNGYTGTLQNGAAIGGPGSGPPVSDPNSSALVLNNGAVGTAYATAGGTNPLQGGISSSGSIIAWINLASLPSTQNRIFSIAGESQSGNDLDLQINGDNRVAFYTDGGSATVTDSLTAANLNSWLFVAATFNAGGERDVYLNGTLAGSSTAGGHSANTAPFYQGQSNVFGGRYFDGSLSDVGLFNVALSATQVADLYAASFVGQPTAVPAPASLPVLVSGLVALLAARRRRGAPSQAA